MVSATEYTCLMSKQQRPRGIHFLKTFFLSPFVKPLNEKPTYSSTRLCKEVDCLVVVFPSLGQALSTWPNPQSLRQTRSPIIIMGRHTRSLHTSLRCHNYDKMLTIKFKHNPIEKCRYFYKPDLQKISSLMQLHRYFFMPDSGMLIAHKDAEPSVQVLCITVKPGKACGNWLR